MKLYNGIAYMTQEEFEGISREVPSDPVKNDMYIGPSMFKDGKDYLYTYPNHPEVPVRNFLGYTKIVYPIEIIQ